MKSLLFITLSLFALNGCGRHVENIDHNSDEMSDEMKDIKAQLQILNSFIAQLAGAGLTLTEFIQVMLTSMQKGSDEIDDGEIDMDDFFGNTEENRETNTMGEENGDF